MVIDENKSIHQKKDQFFPKEKQVFLERTQFLQADISTKDASLQTKLSRQTPFYFKQSRLGFFTRSAQKFPVKVEDFEVEC